MPRFNIGGAETYSKVGEGLGYCLCSISQSLLDQVDYVLNALLDGCRANSHLLGYLFVRHAAEELASKNFSVPGTQKGDNLLNRIPVTLITCRTK
jgi:hypothetical protein